MTQYGEIGIPSWITELEKGPYLNSQLLETKNELIVCC